MLLRDEVAVNLMVLPRGYRGYRKAGRRSGRSCIPRRGLCPRFLPSRSQGDFRVENILVGRSGEIVVADWQEVGPGRGPEDLSFFLQRASFSGGTPPEQQMIHVYWRSLVANIEGGVPLSDIERFVKADELLTRLLHGPALLADASENQMATLLGRIRFLAASLGYG
jgi:hypothetical protein